MNEPKTIYAGDKIEWTESNSDYPASEGWTYKVRLINSAGKIDIGSTADGDDHDVSIASTTSAAYTAGKYMLQPYYEHTDGTKEFQTQFEVEVIADILLVNTYDYRSHAQTTLDAIEAMIESRASVAQQSIQISTPLGGRSLQYLTFEELIKAKEYYTALVEGEKEKARVEAGLKPGGRYLVQFE